MSEPCQSDTGLGLVACGDDETIGDSRGGLELDE